MLQRKREKPRRKKHPVPMPGAMQHSRIKDTRKRNMNAAEKFHADRICAMGCLICRRPAQFHHETKVTGRRDHRYGVPLCPDHHTDKPGARHKGSLDEFNARWGVDLVTWAKEQWVISCEVRETGNCRLA